jgi:hypothetical protein
MDNSKSRVQNLDPFERPIGSLVRFVVKALNGDLSRKLKYNRGCLIHLVEKLRELDREWLDTKNRHKDHDDLWLPETVNDVEEILGGYIGSPSLMNIGADSNGSPERWVVHWRRTDNMPHEDLGLALDVVGILQAGKISSLRQCEQCKTWLFARFPHQRFCSEECKDQFHAMNEADKARRREWARANYQARKELELGSRKAAHRKGGKK